MRIGITELIVVFVVALFVVGPDKLPVYARKLGEALAQFRKYSEAATKDIKECIVEPLEEAQRPLREAVEPLNELNQELSGNVKEVKSSFAGIGKTKKDSSKGNSQGEKTDKEPETCQRESNLSGDKSLEAEPVEENTGKDVPEKAKEGQE
ncbi:MAG: twin-arginine translocase TatA/TatE family subunit [Eubacteriales bacterium]|nr:twin-arginine translocase TatA/TatE family subunit [Eubacteriales bacterium]